MPSKKTNKKRALKNVSHQQNTEDGPEQQEVSEDLKNLRKLIQDIENTHVVQTKELEAQKMTQNIVEKPDIELVKNDSKQFVFHITHKDESRFETYSVQIFKSKTKLELGKLKMPTGLDFERILSETPLTNNQGITRFVRNCQRYISFYHERKKKFEDCKLFLQDAVNCYIDTNYNYTSMDLQLIRVFDASIEQFFNVSIYLFFDLAGLDTTGVKVEANVNEEFKDAALKHLDFCNELFTDNEIEDALKIFEEDEKIDPISWKLEFAGDEQYSTDSSDQSDENRSDNDDYDETLPGVSNKKILRRRKPKISKGGQKSETLVKERAKEKTKGLTIEKKKKSTPKISLKQTTLNFSTQKRNLNSTDALNGQKSSTASKDNSAQNENATVAQNFNTVGAQENVKSVSSNKKNPEVVKPRKFFKTSAPSIPGPPAKRKKVKK